jgi:hypothetical protein
MEEKKKDFNEPIEDKRPATTVNVTSGAFPLSLWCEWDKDCKDRFGDCRWMKMWHDHQMSQKFDIFAVLIDEVQELRKQFQLLNKNKKDEPTGVKTLSGVVKE